MSDGKFYVYCMYCQKSYPARAEEEALWRGALWQIKPGRIPWRPVLCVSPFGQVSREGFSTGYRWHVPKREFEVLVVPSQDAERGFWWPLGLTLFEIPDQTTAARRE